MNGPWTRPASALPSGRQDNQRAVAAQAGGRNGRPAVEARASEADARHKTDEEAVITVNEQTIRLAAHAGEKLANSDDAAGELSDRQKLDLSPGKYKVTLEVAGSAAQNREVEVAANETWGLLVGPDGALLPLRLY
jgi:hypothetical protein